MIFDSYLSKTASEIDKHVDKTLLDFFQKYKTSSRLEELFHAFSEANQGGKRIRGTLIVLGYELSGKNITSDVFRLASLYEILQTSLLIHDDVIDRSEIRRGRPSIYKKFGKNHNAISQGISLGDLGYFFVEEEVSTCDFGSDINVRIFQKLNHILALTAVGQMLDVSFEKESMPKEEDIFQMMEYKTSNYTFTGPLQLGMIAGGDSEKIKQVEGFGKHLGIAFQLQDDLLGVFGSEKESGKSNTSDILEGKMTLLFTYAFSHSDAKQKEFLMRTYGDSLISEEEIKRVCTLFEEAGARSYVERLSDSHFQRALECIDEITQKDLEKKNLVSLIQFIKQRTN